MEILFYRYGSICEPDLIDAFKSYGIRVLEETSMISNKGISASDTVKTVSALMKSHNFLFVFSVNFFPAISEICNITAVPYVAWTVDCPVRELFSKSLANPCNRVFLFDRGQYLYFKKYNPEGIFYLPLASSPERWDRVLASASHAEKKKYTSDVSFVGSLYNEKNPYRKIKGMSEHARGYIEGIEAAQLQVYGENLIEGLLTEKITDELKKIVPDMTQGYAAENENAAAYILANDFIGADIAEKERRELLSSTASIVQTELYTLSDATELTEACKKKNATGLRVHGGVKTLTEMPLVFNGSRINLNITMRPISTGLSLRVFDICACGGFLMCNYQEELPEMFEPGVEAEFFTSAEELLDKISWYLEHEDERKSIALKGYERVKKEHSWKLRVASLIRMVNSTL
ncbi:MAG: DUF3880 domain-containing protein [Lachnospiraceae bacterium]|nr:glycosyltransferase [Lachnospiraceae bacterium]MCR4938306.1 DUF3880 domain-containing protein [Lachnospiraceae bacterium]